MNMDGSQKEQTKTGPFRYRDGRLYFTWQFERRLFFVGTLIMLSWGLLVKVGVL